MAVTNTYGPALHELRGLQDKTRQCFGGLTMLMEEKWHEYDGLRSQLVYIDSHAPKGGEGRERRHYEVIREQTRALLRDLHVALRVLRAALDETYVAEHKQGTVVVRKRSTERARNVSESEGDARVEGGEGQPQEQGTDRSEGRCGDASVPVIGEGKASPRLYDVQSGRAEEGPGRRGHSMPAGSGAQLTENHHDEEEEEEEEEESEDEEGEEDAADAETQPCNPLPRPPCPFSVCGDRAAPPTAPPPPCAPTPHAPTAPPPPSTPDPVPSPPVPPMSPCPSSPLIIPAISTPASPFPSPLDASPPPRRRAPFKTFSLHGPSTASPSLAAPLPPSHPSPTTPSSYSYGDTATCRPRSASSPSSTPTSTSTSTHTAPPPPSPRPPPLPCPSPLASSPLCPGSAFSSPARHTHPHPRPPQDDRDDEETAAFVETLLD